MTGVPWDQWIRPGQTLVDVGANNGWFAGTFLSATGPTGRVIAFEPDPVVAARCVTHCGGSDRLTMRVEAVGQVSGSSTFHRGGTQGTRYQANAGHKTTETFEVPVVTLDEALADVVIHGIKIDAQGDDGWVLEGGQETLRRMPPGSFVLMELWPAGLAAAGFEVARIADLLAGWTLKATGKNYTETTETLRHLVTDVTGWTGHKHTNLLCRKDG